MLLRYDMNRYAMVMDRNEGPNNRPVVIEGERNRVVKEGITERAEFAVENVLPEVLNLVQSKIDTTNNVPLCSGVTYGVYFNTDCSTISPYAVASSYDNLVRRGMVSSDGRPKGMPDHEHDVSVLKNQHKAPSAMTK